MRLRDLFLAAALTSAVVLGAPAARAQNQAETVSVDAAAERHPIDARIYGVAYGSAAALADLNAPLNRQGGNPTSRYNWQQNADNRAMDYFFESLGDASSTPGERGDTFISESRAGGADAMLTIPTIGWVARLGPGRARLGSFSISKYGAQQQSDPYFPDAGNGVLSNGTSVSGNDPNDANVPADSTFQMGWVNHLVGRWGTASSGGLRYYLLDNEPSIWFGTHRDVAPTGATMQQILDKTLDYGGRIKALDPSAVVVGPEEWGWSGYVYSGYDQQYGSLHGWGNLPDRAAHNGMDYLPWLLDQLRQRDAATGQRILDVFSVHYYPQGGEFGNDTSTTMQLLRNRSTRSLWDASYVDQSWINDKVQLIPRLKGWVATYYPNTRIGLTEYNWGAEGHVNGATAQADVLGILGREGIDLATRWTTPDASTPTYKAMKLYRNYDGNRSTFGDTSVHAGVANPDNLAAFAAVRSSDGALTVMVVDKYLSGSTPLTLDLAGFAATGAAHVYQLTSANAIDHLPDLAVSSGRLTATLPPQSVTLFVIEGGVPAASALTVSPASHDFGVVTVGSSSEATITLTNAGSATVAGSATTAAPFSVVSGASYTLAASQSAVVVVRFAPTVGGAAAGSITFSGAGPAKASLAGTGASAPAPGGNPGAGTGSGTGAGSLSRAGGTPPPAASGGGGGGCVVGASRPTGAAQLAPLLALLLTIASRRRRAMGRS